MVTVTLSMFNNSSNTYLTLFHLNYFAKLKIYHNVLIFGPMTIFCIYQFKVDHGYISLNGNMLASKQDINNLKTPTWS